MSNTPAPDPEMLASLRRLGLIDDMSKTRFEALSGGVSSDIWKVTTDEQMFCVKRALAKLKVQAEWLAPVERNRFEVAWYRAAGDIVPGAAPRILGHDEQAMLCAMEYLDPDDYKLWKNELRDGRADPLAAAECGRRLLRIHSATADNETIAQLFPQNDIFHAIRLEPYLEATATAHPDLHEQLFALSHRTAQTRRVMIHGDVSPKNILLGPDGPVFLDAECACIGDPAFDLAFCLNHFLLKCLWTAAARDGFFNCFQQMTNAYLSGVDWEDPADLERRTATLLPGLFLARVDGKSPVEYIHEHHDKEQVRQCARALLQQPPVTLAEVLDAWKKQLKE